MVNTTALNNLSSFEFNQTIISNTESITSSIVNNANTSTDGFIGLIILTLIYMWLLYITMKKDGVFQLDFVRSNVLSSGVVVVLGFILLVTDIISIFQHVIWFVVIFSFSSVGAYFLKKKNL